MKLIHLMLVIALIVPFSGCNWLDDPQVKELQQRIQNITNENTKWQAEANKQLDELKEQLNQIQDGLKIVHTENQKLKAANLRLGADNLRLATINASLIETVKEFEAAPDTKPLAQHKVIFAHNQLYNNPVTKKIAVDVLAMVKKYDGRVRITVEGYSSKAGKAAYNMWLSKERAEGVAHKLFSAGVDEANVQIIAHGETDSNQRAVTVTVEVLE